MLDASQIESLYDRYFKLATAGDVDGVVNLYAEDATIEDPIGSDLHRGHEAIRKFYEASAGSFVMRRTGPVRAAGLEAASPVVVLMGPPGPEQKVLDIISTMVFSEDGKILAMRAYWNFGALRPTTDADRG